MPWLSLSTFYATCSTWRMLYRQADQLRLASARSPRCAPASETARQAELPHEESSRAPCGAANRHRHHCSELKERGISGASRCPGVRGGCPRKAPLPHLVRSENPVAQAYRLDPSNEKRGRSLLFGNCPSAARDPPACLDEFDISSRFFACSRSRNVEHLGFGINRHHRTHELGETEGQLARPTGQVQDTVRSAQPASARNPLDQCRRIWRTAGHIVLCGGLETPLPIRSHDVS